MTILDAFLALIVVGVALCGWMLFKVYGPPTGGRPGRQERGKDNAARQFPDAMKQLLEEQVRELPDAAIRFALQGRIDVALLLGDSERSLLLQELFFELDRLEQGTLRAKVLAQLSRERDGHHPVVTFLLQPPDLREAMIAMKVVDQLRIALASLVGLERTAVDFERAGLLPRGEEQWVRWCCGGAARDWFQCLSEQAQSGIGTDRLDALIEAAAREVGKTVPLICFPNLLSIFPAVCLTPEKSYAAGRIALWNDFVQTRQSLQSSENALRQLNDELEERVRIRTDELEIAKVRAEESSRAKSEFLANMSHEIRTPMNGVLGMTELLLATELNDRQCHMAETIHRSGEALLTIINEILDFSKIEAGKFQLESIEFSLRDVIQDVMTLFAKLAKEKGLHLSSVIHEAVPLVLRGDPVRVRQVFLNLVGNAIKFTARGTVSLGVELLTESQDEAVVRLRVADTGIGIPLEAQTRIFDAFTQADGSTTRHYGGTGLGLTIVKQLVTRMGGEIRVESRPGQGATFWATARFKKALRDSKCATDEHFRRDEGNGVRSLATAIGPKHILLAEDNPVNTEVSIATLELLGFTVKAVQNGQEAIDISARETFDLILIDCQMPGMDGFEATRRIRVREGTGQTRNRRVPIIALTAYAMTGDRERCLAAGMDDYLTKPFTHENLEVMLSRWLAAPSDAEVQRNERKIA